MTKQKESDTSENGLKPNTFPFPNIYVDKCMVYQTSDEWKVLSLFVRKIYGWRKEVDWIAHSQIMGYTGLSEATVRKCLDALQLFNLVVMVQPSDPATKKGALWGLQDEEGKINFQAMIDRKAGKKQKNSSRTEKARSKKRVMSDVPPMSDITGNVAQSGTGDVAQTGTGYVAHDIQNPSLQNPINKTQNIIGAQSAPVFSAFPEDDLLEEKGQPEGKQEDRDRIPLEGSSLPATSFPPPTALAPRKSSSHKKGDLVDGMLRYARQPGQVDVADYPEDLQAILKAFAETFNLLPPVKGRKGGQYDLWVKDGRELLDACAEFGAGLMPDIKQAWTHKDAPGHPGAVLYYARSQAATRRSSSMPVQASHRLTDEEVKAWREKNVKGTVGDRLAQMGLIDLNSGSPHGL